ncbi:PAS domain-containing protein [Sporosarcina sp. ANT_H38]|uniref:sigma-54-dependent Fis family transcriptional regulator n=1 Tax=Sporosarcina sp. ANT_H38 TaxID=2597358 RepID=UPI0011F2339B|nr:sigma-54-dependent Fis family transcriptional regulator [Sporosarcina sp. ANT_H38]KAA0965197.1 PAS domain-containing protein [Sporosarcina sp. ANT_H38]
MQVHQLSSSNFIKITRKSTVRDVMKHFLNQQQDLACVIENEQLLGIVTKYSLYRLLLENGSLDVSIEPIIIKNVVTIYEEENAYYAKDLLIKKGVGHAVVINKMGKVTGVMAKSELIKGLITSAHNVANRLKSLVNHLQEAVISVDLEMRITSVNTTALALFQLQEQELLNRSISQYFSNLSAGLQDSITTEQTFIKRLYFPNMTTIASFIPIREWSSVTGAMVVLKDVTDFEKVAKELESTKRIEKVLESALELAYDGVLITDTEGIITRVNHSFLSLFGYQSLQEVINQPIKHIVPEIPSDKSILHNEKIEGELIEIRNKKAILTQMPIIQDGEKIGAIFKIIFKQLDVWKDLLHHMERLEGEISYYRGELIKVSFENDPFGLIISKNKNINQLKKEAYIASQTFSNILITGESGTGKELIADGIHQSSGRPGAFIKVNCGAIPEELLESEFFGYVDGAFTGARKGGKPGKFELAEGGTIFLDEIGDMPLSLQVKLLRVLQEKEFERIGDTKTTKIDVRILTATNKDLLNMVHKGLFREDLYYRIHVIQLHLPPLRERINDIPLLCEFFLQKFTTKKFKHIEGLTRDALEKLTQYEWPGNVRELENVLERAFHFSTSNWIEKDNLYFDSYRVQSVEETHKVPTQTFTQSNGINRKELLNETERSVLIQALTEANGNRTKAAEILKISRSTLYHKLKKYRIKENSQFKSED